jgi:ATP-dependent helicase/nuclease subunit B
MLTQLAALGTVAPRLTRPQALAALRSAASESVFQPEGREVPIQILGVLEASGITFDAVWVAGLVADRWPPPASPNPLLPIDWQRDRGVPRASAQRELAYAQRLTDDFARAAVEVVFSSAATVDDHPAAPSALILAFPERAFPSAASSWIDGIAASATLERVTDDRAPRIASGSVVRGGSNVIASQSDCPFRAVARHRLGADRWQTTLVGLSAAERGMAVHAMLAAFWGEVTDSSALHGREASALQTTIERAVDAGLATMSSARWALLPTAVRGGETRRLRGLLEAWIDVERLRQPFAVRDCERPSPLALAGLTFQLRFDRIDTLTDGGVAIIDYKTGVAEQPKRWFDDRPRAAQLGMYTLAQHAADAATPIRAVVYAQLRHDAVKAVGIVGDAAAWPMLTPLQDVAMFSGWPDVERWWRVHLEALATEIAGGHAAVRPRQSPLPCRDCGMQPLCRIESIRMLNEDEAADE